MAKADRLQALGIDAEPHLPLPPGLLDDIASAEEIGALGELAQALPAVHWDRLTFSAKESVYKAWFPCTASGRSSTTPPCASTRESGRSAPGLGPCQGRSRRSRGRRS